MMFQVHQKVYIICFLLSASKFVHCEQICSKNQYVKKDTQGNFESCLTCNNCPAGSGLFPPCGTILYQNVNIDCLACTGNTYSDEHGPGSCKTCAICSSNEIVNKTCTPEDNTVCSKTCVRGYYYDTNTHNCQPCSQCCSKDENSKMEECKRHGMPLTKQCSVHQSQHCRTRASTTQPSGSTRQPSDVTSLPTGGTQTTMYNSSGKLAAFISLGIVLAISFITVTLIKSGIIRVPCRRKNDVEAEVARDGANRDDNMVAGYAYNVAFERLRVVQPGSSLANMSPQEGQKWKLLKELHHGIREKLEDMLAPDRLDGVGNWYNLGMEYGMDEYKLEQLKSNKNCKEAAHSVLAYIDAAKPNLKVHDFSKTMEKIKKNEIVDLLKDHMFTQEEEDES